MSLPKIPFYPDFDDVMIIPSMSEVNSRSEVDLRLHLNQWSPIPIMSANMDTITDVNSAFELLKHNWIPVLHKYVSISDISSLFDKIEAYNLEVLKNTSIPFLDIIDFNNKTVLLNKNNSEPLPFLIDKKNVFVSRGTSDQDKIKLKERLEQEPRIESICIDVANGHRLDILPYLKSLKETYPDKTLMAGNIVTSEAAILYALNGVNILKCGIGPGCFEKGSKVITKEGLKNIEDIIPGQDYVITHKNRYRKVLNKFVYEEKDKLISINGINSTLSHEYFVVNKNYSNIETESFWIQAKDLLMENHYLIKDNKPISISSIQEISFSGEVIDLEVEEDYSYNIEGIVVHNSACITRVQTGVGVPQIGMVMEIKQGIKQELNRLSSIEPSSPLIDLLSNVKICVDGGMKRTGDIAKSFVAGADFVMLGGMLAGHKESPGSEEIVDGKRVKRFSGMAASISQQSGVPSYGVEEGKTVFIPYKGKLKNTIQNIEGGLRSSGTYINAFSISDFKNASFARTNVQENRIFS